MIDYRIGDLVEVNDGDANADDVNAALQALLESCDDGLAGAIVRLKVEDFPRAEREHIDQKLVRELRPKLTLFNLDLRYAAATDRPIETAGERVSLAMEAAAWFADDPAEVRALALRMLELDEQPAEQVEEVAA
jgi:hypothetical protein